ncbi:MAG TPA: energy transducer TonB [Pyrinomonadaceae bacterium]
MLKRMLPFMLTLTVGLILGSWFNPYSLRNHRYGRFMSRCSGASSYGTSRVVSPSDKTWALIRTQPVVEYTPDARRDQVTGRVRLRVLLDAGGTVTQVIPLETLPDGLTDAAIDSAWRTKFVPATENGVPVSVWIEQVHEFAGDRVSSYAKDNVYEVVHTPNNQ